MTSSILKNLHEPSRFSSLGPAFFSQVQPTPLHKPYLVDASPAVFELLGLECEMSAADVLVLSGHLAASSGKYIASVYSGHQFGIWAGQLGDGRAMLLGDMTHHDCFWEVQLKGSGRTPYSRMGDGRAVLRSSIREYLCSEAMAGLGIPTTRALAMIGSDEPVLREEIETAAVVTRVAPSFIRFGHFEHFSARQQYIELQQLADFVLVHYYPECQNESQPYIAMLGAIIRRTAHLVAHWQVSGFCHGVLNTDNMSILGLTLDYGPFGFLDAFDAQHVCNHSDHQGRYAYDQQPGIALWNLARLVESMLPLMMESDIKTEQARAYAQALLEEYEPTYQATMLKMMRLKLGLRLKRDDDSAFIDALFKLLDTYKVDFTLFFRKLCAFCIDDTATSANMGSLFFSNAMAWEAWCARYRARLSWEQSQDISRQQSMLQVNPKYILRQHLLEVAIKKAKEKDFSEIATLRKIMTNPFAEQEEYAAYAALPPAWAKDLHVSCSS